MASPLPLLLFLASLCISCNSQRTWNVGTAESIANAINQAQSGDVISLAAGVHTPDAEIRLLNKNITFKGEGPGVTVISSSPVVDILFTVGGFPQDVVRFEDLTFRGDDLTDLTRNRFLLLSSDVSMLVTNVVFEEGFSPVRVTSGKVVFQSVTMRSISNPGDVGGCLQMFSPGTLEVYSSLFSGCSSGSDGGAVYVATAARFVDTVWDGNISDDDGVCVLLEGNTLTASFFENCTFTNNVAGGNGIVYSRSGPARKDAVTLSYVGCTFADNVSEDDRESMVVDFKKRIGVIDACTFTRNTAQYVAIASSKSNVTITRSEFSDNAVGVAILAMPGHLHVGDCSISGGPRGMEIYLRGQEISVVNTRVSDMTLETDTDLVSDLHTTGTPAGGAGILFVGDEDLGAESVVRVAGCTFERLSSALDGGAFHFVAVDAAQFRFEDTKVASVTSSKCGGVLSMTSPGLDLTVEGCEFRDVRADYGGFMCFQADCAALSMADSTISASSARVAGGLYFHNATSPFCKDPKCSGCKISGTSADGYGTTSATRPAKIVVDTSSSEVCEDDDFSVCGTVQDAFGQDATGFPDLQMSLALRFVGVTPTPGVLPDPSSDGAYSLLSDNPQLVEGAKVCFQGVRLTGPEDTDVQVSVFVSHVFDTTTVLFTTNSTMTFTYCTDYIEWDSGYGIVLITLVALAVLFLVVTIGAIVVNRNEKCIRALSWTMILVAYVGLLMLLATVLMLIGERTDGICVALPIVGGLGYAIAVSAVCIRMLRLYIIFKSAEKMKKIVVGDMYVLAGVAVALVGEVIVLVIWMTVDRPEREGYDCSSPHIALLAVFLVYNCLVLVPGVVLAWLTRSFPRVYSDAKWIGFAIYSLVIFIVPGLVLVLAADLSNADTSFIVGLLTVLACIVFPALVVLPRILEYKFGVVSTTASGGSHPSYVHSST